MNEYLRKVAVQIKEFFSNLSPAKKFAVLATGIAIMVGIATVFSWAGKKSFRPLMTNLNAEDSASIIRFLREKNIPFKVDEQGRSVEVPPENLHELRLALATQGLPESGTVGYELFDRQSLGTTSFVNQVNSKRALEGELMRTIRTIKGVRKARVHLAIPKKSTFVEDQKDPSASVVVDLEPGFRLNTKQIYGIGVLVARAVEGLDSSAVVIVDSHGRLLSKNTRDSAVALSASQLDYKRNMEEGLEKRVEQLLGRVVGEGKVEAKVTAELDFSRVSETQTLYDPDGAAVRSTNRNVQSMEGSRPGPVGRPGTATNTPDQPNPDPNAIRSNTQKNREVVNYEVPQTVKQVVKPYGEVKKLSVAVLVDGKKTTEKAESGELFQKTVAWTPEELQQFQTVIAGALGIDPKRGDSIQIRNMEFAETNFDEAERIIAENERRAYIQNLVTYGVIGLIVALFFLFVVRPYIKWVTENTIDNVDSYLPKTLEELERMQKDSKLPGMEETVPVVPEKIDPDKVEGEMIKEKIITLVDNNPHKAALVLRDWLHGEERKKPKAEETTA